MQNENGTFATSAIATTTTSVTRAADVATITTLTPWYNASVGTLLVTCATAYAGDTSSNKGVAAFTDGTLNNSIVLRHGVGNTAGMLVNTGGVTQANFGSGAWTNTSVHKFATAWAVNDFASYFDGVATGTDTAGTIPTVTQLELGRYTTGGTLCGWLQSLRYYPTRLPNATLQALTL